VAAAAAPAPAVTTSTTLGLREAAAAANIKGTFIQPTTTVMAVGAGAAGSPNMTLPQPTNVSQPCYEMNQSATVKQLQNAAQLSATAAQAALEAVSKAGKVPSNAAATAYATANEAAAIWERLLHTAVRTEQETLTASGQLHAMKKIGEKASADYEKAIMKVRDFPPHIPKVRWNEILRGVHRT